MTMTVLPKIALPLGAAVILALSGCHTSAATSHASSTPAAGASDRTSQAAASDRSDAAPQAAKGKVPACSIVTEHELTALLGADPGPGADNSDSTTTACAYTGAGAATVVVDHSGGKTQFDMYCTAKPSQPGVQNMNGIAVADGACLGIVGKSIAVMYILKGRDLISINIQAGLDTTIAPA